MALESIGFHTTRKGKKYDLIFSPDGKFAQAVLLPVSVGAGHPVLQIEAHSEEEALKKLVEELDKGDH